MKFTLPNNDPGSQTIRKMQINFARNHANSVTIPALGERKYLGLLKLADEPAVASVEPALPEPARVVTTPDDITILRIL